jgi:membrane-bound ClpP family serine protease
MKSISSHFLQTPQTIPGRWSVGLAIASVILILAWSIMPGGAWFGFLCGIAGGITALIAIIRQREYSWAVWLPLLPLLFVMLFFVGELLIPH